MWTGFASSDWNVSPDSDLKTDFIFLIEPPVIVRPFESTELVKGTDIILEGTVSGSAPFEISCFLNEKLIRSDKKHQVSVVKDTVTLQVSDCDTRDAGTYHCIVANDVGEASCSCQISLKGQSKNIFVLFPTLTLPKKCLDVPHFNLTQVCFCSKYSLLHVVS